MEVTITLSYQENYPVVSITLLTNKGNQWECKQVLIYPGFCLQHDWISTRWTNQPKHLKNWPGPKRRWIIFQPSIFRGEMAVSFRVRVMRFLNFQGTYTPGSSNIAGWKMGAPDWVDVFPSLKMGMSFQPAMLYSILEGKGVNWMVTQGFYSTWYIFLGMQQFELAFRSLIDHPNAVPHLC